MGKTLVEIISSIVGIVISYFLKQAFNEALCDISSFGCFMGFIAYQLPVIIIGAYWTIKIYNYFK